MTLLISLAGKAGIYIELNKKQEFTFLEADEPNSIYTLLLYKPKQFPDLFSFFIQ